ncbi:outer membrane beta-barrel protein [Fulvivirga ulvae]|uniref:outer membrane beta-barrel protein n=1 Tax=Fulvivirga ulvae TaxID=2904245 RepID=UPI002107AC04|nr:outer membrane beta-barrel protein [Fulvivirga ulvae]
MDWKGETYGIEANMSYQVMSWWQLSTNINLLEEDIRIKEGKTDFNNTYNETADPKAQFLFRSTFELPHSISINGAFRWVDELPINNAGVRETVPDNAELDGSIGWQASNKLRLTVAGRNLLHKEHVEYGILGSTRQAIKRSVYLRLSMHL